MILSLAWRSGAGKAAGGGGEAHRGLECPAEGARLRGGGGRRPAAGGGGGGSPGLGKWGIGGQTVLTTPLPPPPPPPPLPFSPLLPLRRAPVAGVAG
ncbi:hypothetical protein DAI22_08g223250 [Oryza sativa Japonica Group]|nr:hypothetical protein DAI22_08g223250 [Oryza sativa Japonica Group]